MARELRILERHFRQWREEELLSEELETALRLSSETLTRRSTAATLRTALAALGGGLVLSGLILIIAENWDGLHRSLKLGGWAVFQLAFLFAAFHLSRVWPDRPALAETMAFVAGGWVLAGIALVSQIYQLDSRPPYGIWFWLVLVLPAAWLLERKSVGVVLFIALVSALALEAEQADSVFRVHDSGGPWIWIGVPLLATGLVSWLPTPVPVIREWTAAWTFLASNICLLVFGAHQALSSSDLGRGWWLAGAGILLGLALPARTLSRSWDRLTCSLVLGATFLPWLFLGARYDAGLVLEDFAVGVAWIVQLLVAILVIRAGARSGSEAWVNLGYLALLAGILTRYFDFFQNYLQGGAALALSGTLILFILYSLERARRRTLRKQEVPA